MPVFTEFVSCKSVAEAWATTPVIPWYFFLQRDIIKERSQSRFRKEAMTMATTIMMLLIVLLAIASIPWLEKFNRGTMHHTDLMAGDE